LAPAPPCRSQAAELASSTSERSVPAPPSRP
jgi:hypothetical protein